MSDRGVGAGRRGRDSGRKRSPGSSRGDEGPPIPDEVNGQDLPSDVRAELIGLPRMVADRIARRLVAAGKLLDEDPDLAAKHAWAARQEGARLAVVREACGVAAYAAGQFERALAELRAARRMSGSEEHIALIVDCERGLERPERALEVGRAVTQEQVSRAGWVELQIVLAGARRDCGQTEAALRLLELPELRGDETGSATARLRYAYADTLESLGRYTEAEEWFVRAQLADEDDETDADERRGRVAATRDTGASARRDE